MANTATTYLKETSKQGTLWEGPVCDACLAEHLQRMPPLRRGERRITRAWNGAVTECMWCPDSEWQRMMDDDAAERDRKAQGLPR